MKKFLLRLYRRTILRSVRFWQSRWGEKSLLVVLAIGIGAVAAVAAALLHTLVTRLEQFGIWLTQKPKELHEFAWLAVLLVLPLVGLVASFLVQRYFGGPRYAKSLSPLILALNRKRTNIPAIEMINHLFSSALSVGFGGSAGLEAPSVLTGAAIGANTGGFLALSLVHISEPTRQCWIACGVMCV